MHKEIDKLILNTTTRQEIEKYLSNPTHALILSGKPGVGLGTIARALAKDVASSNHMVITPTIHKQQKTSIVSAEDIKDIFSLANIKHDHNFALVVDNVDMSASGVFERLLKVIEEPSSGMFYIFTSHNPNDLPRTIFSRCAHIAVKAISKDQSAELVSSLDNQKKNQILFLANGLPAEINRLVSDDQYFSNQSAMTVLAKKFLTSSAADRLAIINDIKDRDNAMVFCKCAAQLLIKTGDMTGQRKFLSELNKAGDHMTGNANYKTQLLPLIWL